MDQDTDLFVQAFWVKCREVIRPEIDSAVDDLRHAGHGANVATQEFSAVADRLPAPAGPSVTLAVRLADATADAIHPTIEFHGDVRREAVDVVRSGGHKQSYELAALGTAEVRHQDDATATIEHGAERGQGLADATLIGDGPVFDGDVEVNPHEHALAGDVEGGDGFLGHGWVRG